MKTTNDDNLGHDDINWVQVADALGDSQIKMIVEHLRASEIHAVAIESSALGLLTGANSVARVMVPEEEVGQALDLLEPEKDEELEEDISKEDEFTEELGTFDKAVLGATAIIMSPLGAGIGYVIARTFAEDEDLVDVNDVVCPVCGTALELSDDEVKQRWFRCPECEQVIPLDDFVICSACRTELELDDVEKSQGWFICPECRRAMRIKHR